MDPLKMFEYTSPCRLECILANSANDQRLGRVQVKVERLKLCSDLERVESWLY
jgi:hypothetical protein